MSKSFHSYRLRGLNTRERGREEREIRERREKREERRGKREKRMFL